AAVTGRTREGWQEWRQMRLEEGQAGQQPEEEAESRVVAAETDLTDSVEQVQVQVQAEAAPVPAPQVQVRFYLLEKLEKLFS
ncbi:MAG: hypothetical protein K0R47_4772, partial [Brevibacillus sp.]|nr:hypothetical protein [Brevibacillus sp.]